VRPSQQQSITLEGSAIYDVVAEKVISICHEYASDAELVDALL